MDYDATDIPVAYDRGRSHGPEVVDLWMNAVSSYVEVEFIASILDLGCGLTCFRYVRKLTMTAATSDNWRLCSRKSKKRPVSRDFVWVQESGGATRNANTQRVRRPVAPVSRIEFARGSTPTTPRSVATRP